jgi:hypothetical protein
MEKEEKKEQGKHWKIPHHSVPPTITNSSPIHYLTVAIKTTAV